MTPEARRRRRVRTPVLAVTAVAWALLLLTSVSASSTSDAVPSAALAARLGSHGHLATGPAASTASEGAPGARLAEPRGAGLHAVHPGPAGLLAGGALMLTAMMAPLLIPALRHASGHSLPGRRLRTMALVAAPGAVIWLGGWIVLAALATRALEMSDPSRLVAVVGGLVGAAVWQASPLKQQCLNRHHSHPPLAAFGWPASVDALRFGTRHAAWCLGSCWSLMLLPLLVPAGHLWAMLAVTLWMWAEEFERPGSPAWRLRAPTRAARIISAQAGAILGRPRHRAAMHG